MIQETEFNPQDLKWKDNYAGVYTIDCIHNGMRYIGSSVHVWKRLKREHLWALRAKRHGNWKLQRDFNRYGIEGFTVGVIEIVPDLASARRREQWFINLALKYGDKDNLYNISETVDLYDGHNRRKAFELIAPSGERKSFLGVKQFCRDYDLDYAAIQRVIKNPVFTFKGWKNVNHVDRSAKIATFMNPEGKLVTMTQGDFKQRSIEEGFMKQGFQSLWVGRFQSYKGWSRADASLHKRILSPTRENFVIPPDGLAAFCRKHGIHAKYLSEVIKGKRKSYLGWTFIETLPSPC